jgi:hypothetical protein
MHMVVRMEIRLARERGRVLYLRDNGGQGHGRTEQSQEKLLHPGSAMVGAVFIFLRSQYFLEMR